MKHFTYFVFIIISTVSIAQKLSDKIQKISLITDKKLAYNTDDRFYGDLVPSVQVAKWKTGYVISYVTFERKSRVFFTDKRFNKISSEQELSNRIIFQIVTDNDEIALLTGDRNIDDDDEIASHFIFFTKITEQGKITLEKKIIGTYDLQKSGETILDDWGNFNMKWTGHMYMLFFPIQYNFAEKSEAADIHQGACSYMIKSDGTLYSLFDWNNSHSFEHRILMTKNHAVLLNKGDASPRGLGVEWYPINEFYFEKIEDDPDERDLGNPSIEYFYMYEDENEYSCDAFTVSGQEGDNYVPFSIGDAVELADHSVLISYSFIDRKPTHDIGLVKVKPSLTNCTSGPKFITNTPSICEHSVRMFKINNNQFLMMWKEFPTTGINKKMELLSDRYYDEDNGEELIFTHHNPDQNKIAIIDSKGNFIVKPQKVKKSEVDWYYTIALKESNTEWHNIMETFGNYTLSENIYSSDGKIIWTNHKHKSNQINVYIFNP